MSLSKNNSDKLKSILKKESFKNKFSHENLNLDISKTNLTNSSKNNNPEDLFYSIIDNSSTLEETTFNNPKLKNAEDNLLKSKIDKSKSNKFSKQASFNNELSKEELLYDQFNYLLEE
tara:strand:+ start:454 stop:807 length:354 start_codon:yes stop_codon:yes gene_type:complete